MLLLVLVRSCVCVSVFFWIVKIELSKAEQKNMAGKKWKQEF